MIRILIQNLGSVDYHKSLNNVAWRNSCFFIGNNVFLDGTINGLKGIDEGNQ
jgi:hypothetical protein